MAALTREPSGMRASTIGWLSSTRRPTAATILLHDAQQVRLVLERDVRLLQLAVPLDEAVLVTVDQDVVDRGVLEQRLERAKPDHLVDDVVDQRLEFRAIDGKPLLAGLFENEIMHLAAHLVLRQTLERDEVDLLDKHAVQAGARVDDLVGRLGRAGVGLRLRLARRRDDDHLVGASCRLRRELRPDIAVLQGGEAAGHADFLSRRLPMA